MDRRVAEQLISELYEFVLRRKPAPTEYENWVSRAATGVNLDEVVTAFCRAREQQAGREPASVFPPGHYHSPVVDPATVRDYIER